MVFGKKKAKPASDSLSFGGEDVVIPSLEIKTIGIAKDEAQGLMIAARQLPGYPVALVILANAITSRAGDRPGGATVTSRRLAVDGAAKDTQRESRTSTATAP